jgi:putative endonuclease
MERHSDRRHDVGILGEAAAARFLERAGCVVLTRNVRVEADEIDLIVRHGDRTVAVEVKTSSNGDDPLLAVDEAKFERFRRAAANHSLPIHRLDIVTVALDRIGVTYRWLRGVD